MKNKRLGIIAFLLMLLLFTVSCDLLAQNNDSETNFEATVQHAVIETKAAATLEAWDTQDQDETDDQQSDNTEAAATDIPEETATPTVTPTATVPPTPTSPPGDPTAGLGDPDFIDNFDDPTYWWVFDSADSNLSLENNELRYTNKIADNFTLWRASWAEIQDYYLDVITQVPGSCSGKDEFGLLFRTSTASKGHLFTISCDGHYRLRLWDGSDMTVLVERTESEHINADHGAFNRIGVMAADDEISLYVNGFFLETINSATYDMAGPYGVSVNAVETDNLTVHFTELRYWDLSE